MSNLREYIKIAVEILNLVSRSSQTSSKSKKIQSHDPSRTSSPENKSKDIENTKENNSHSISRRNKGFFPRLIRPAVTLLEYFFLYQLVLRLVRRYFKFPAPAIIGRFLDSDFRRRLQPPDLVIQRSGISQGMNVLEIGCGSGAYTTHAARSVGESGKLFAMDIQSGMLRQIRSKLQKPENVDIRNLQVVAGSAHKLPFPNRSLDIVYMVTVFQEIPQQHLLLKEVRRVLKQGGHLSITEFLIDPDYPWVTTTIQTCKEGGFLIDDVSGNLWNYTVRVRNPF